MKTPFTKSVASLVFVIFVGCPFPASSGSATLSNRLATASSLYLREAAQSPVFWQPWGEEAFRLAQELNRPMLLDLGAVWCHWCHVMDEESYKNPEVAALINQHFIPVKVDRDERPASPSRIG